MAEEALAHDANNIISRDRSCRSIERLFRYPVKGFTPEPLDEATLEPGRGFEWDRAVAVTDGSWRYDEASYEPQFKDRFIALLTHPPVAALKLTSDAEAKLLTIASPTGEKFSIDLSLSDSAEDFVEFLIDYLNLPEGLKCSRLSGHLIMPQSG